VWHVEFDPDTRRLSLRLTAHVSAVQMRQLAEAHARALEHTAGEPFKVFIDLRGLFPLEADAVSVLGAMKRVAAQARGCAGFAILADSATIAMQQQRTRVRAGTDPSHELITMEPADAEAFLGG
jgi:hypothetical protein